MNTSVATKIKRGRERVEENELKREEEKREGSFSRKLYPHLHRIQPTPSHVVLIVASIKDPK